ncbi:hypothetical protein GCM10010510_72170 [Streptomyces anandii JCM 4720]|nr:hypothetical protein GCM10010510_72170 [Streptomyces anandii JCM 4720]
MPERYGPWDRVYDLFWRWQPLLPHCEVIFINGPSYRLKNRFKAIERETRVA